MRRDKKMGAKVKIWRKKEENMSRDGMTKRERKDMRRREGRRVERDIKE